jgi:hypothetical protein
MVTRAPGANGNWQPSPHRKSIVLADSSPQPSLRTAIREAATHVTAKSLLKGNRQYHRIGDYA